MRLMPLLLVFAMSSGFAATGADRWTPAPCQDGQVQVLVLGSYHMNNPGHDTVNLKADDVLSPARQQQIEDVVRRLAAFKPDKVMIESPYGTDTYPKRYADYLAGKHELSRNEIEQIGFRLAKTLGHTAIYPVDYPMSQDSRAADFYYSDHPDDAKKLQDAVARLQEEGKKDGERLQQGTVRDYLLYLNSPQSWGFDLDTRMDVQYELGLVEYDEYAGADQLTSWFQRNTRIMANVLRTLTPTDKRVLVLFGAGHNRYLWDLVDDAPQLCRIPVARYLGGN